jgi:hypothetical protein
MRLEDIVSKLFELARADGLSREETAEYLERWSASMVEEHGRECVLHARGKECGFNYGHNRLVELIEARYATLEKTLDADEIDRLFQEKMTQK